MAAALCASNGPLPGATDTSGLPLAQHSKPAPINFLYGHLHNSIRAELDALAAEVAGLETASEDALVQHLQHLKERYHFLEQVYKYHSSVEDEVVYPVLDAKVRNVTLAYSVEHQDEEYLFEQLGKLLTSAVTETGEQRGATIRELVCKVEEIHTTLRKHLAKEEAQLLPLLLAHFSAAEQAELVAQFLYCIPLATVEAVLSWLKQGVPPWELSGLLEQLRHVTRDTLLQQLLVTWLQPTAAAAATATTAAAAAAEPVLTPGQAVGSAAGASPAAAASGQAAAAGAGAPEWPPLRGVVLFHSAIRGALEAFAAEAAGLQAAQDVTPAQLAGLVDRHRFLRSVCMFHSLSEEEVMFPAALHLSSPADPTAPDAATTAACCSCTADHHQEVGLFEQLGRLLADTRAFARRGRREAMTLLGQLVASARSVCAALVAHMAREEAEVLPLLGARLSLEQQRALLWAMLRAMPLRLLEKVLPWLVAHLSPEDALGLMSSMRLGAPTADAQLLELLIRWAQRGCWSPAGGRSIGPAVAAATSSGSSPPHTHHQQQQPQPWGSSELACDLHLVRQRSPEEAAAGDGAGDAAAGPPSKRLRTQPSSSSSGGTTPAADAAAVLSAAADFLPHLQLPKVAVARAGSSNLHDASDPTTHHHPQQGSGAPGDPAVGAAVPVPSTPAGPRPAAQLPRLSGVLSGHSPIDHIFQFHKALRQELKQLEADAAALEAAALSSWEEAAGNQQGQQPLAGQQQQQLGAGDTQSGAAAAAGPGGGDAVHHCHHHHQQPQQGAGNSQAVAAAAGSVPDGARAFLSRCSLALQQLDGRFQFLWGIYRAHSKAEDDIVFPALEAKEALLNVSRAYTLDHEQEEQLFHDLAGVISRVRSSSSMVEVRELSLQLRRMCAAVRASLETHVRAEEAELWPLFSEHFSFEEQQHLVGVIIGRTGAEVLQAMLPWVTGSFSEEEREAMMESLRGATRNTMFEAWLDAIQSGPAGLGAAAAAGGSSTSGGIGRQGSADAGQGAPAHATSSTPAAATGSSSQLPDSLAEIAEYLAPPPQAAGGAAVPQTEASGTVAESTSYRPGWEDIFNINQKQLEAAIRRVSNDPALEPSRKAYLIQNMMVSRYIVAQQRRLAAATTTSAGGASAPAAAPQQQHTCPGHPAAAAGAAGGQPAGGAGAAAARGKGCGTYADPAAGVLGCPHYKRSVQLVAPCCNTVHTCRLCHDDVTDHRLDRYAVTEMVCMLCATRQPVAASCSSCGETLARYYCGICHLFDDEPGRDIYHCPFCNVCRRGKGLGVDFFHCMQCNACMSLSLFNSHTCRERAMEGNCPVCHEYLFDSAAPIKELPCGHFLHSSCFAAYTRYAYTCPICCKSIGDMSVYFQMLDSLLAAERGRLPAGMASQTQAVLCHDCGKSGVAPYHFVYHACPHCRSYNTRVL